MLRLVYFLRPRFVQRSIILRLNRADAVSDRRGHELIMFILHGVVHFYRRRFISQRCSLEFLEDIVEYASARRYLFKSSINLNSLHASPLLPHPLPSESLRSCMPVLPSDHKDTFLFFFFISQILPFFSSIAEPSTYLDLQDIKAWRRCISSRTWDSTIQRIAGNTWSSLEVWPSLFAPVKESLPINSSLEFSGSSRQEKSWQN